MAETTPKGMGAGINAGIGASGGASSSRHRSPAGAAALAVLLLGLAGCGEGGKRRPPALVTVAPASSQRFEQTLNTVSTLEAAEEIELAAQSGGRVQRLLVRTGDPVRAGQLLVVLDQTQLRADVQALRAKAKRDQLAYERFRGLVSQGAASVLQAEEFQANAIGSREALRAKLADLAYKDIRAPIAGVMGDLTIKPGDVVTAGTPFSRIIRNERLLARIDVPAGRMGLLRPGQPVQLLAADDDQPQAEGRISQVDPGVSATSQTLLAEGLDLAQVRLEGQLLPGLSLLRPAGAGVPEALAGLPLITFPGNLGDASTLVESWRLMEGQGPAASAGSPVGALVGP